MKGLKIAVDLDGTVADLISGWSDLLFERYGERMTPERSASWDTHTHINPQIGMKVYDLLKVPGLFRNLRPYKGAIEAVRRFHEAGHEVDIITTAKAASTIHQEKIEWCLEHMPFLKIADINFVEKKSRFTTDVLIDDSPPTIQKHASAQPLSKRIGLAFPYNECVASLMDLRAQSYADTAAAWAEIERFVSALAERSA